jgi:leucyl-tRNA---protein transferase
VIFHLISGTEVLPKISPAGLDERLATGWRHFGTEFFRYSENVYQNEWVSVLPLRIRLADFKPSGSQQKILRRNSDLQTVIQPIRIDDAKMDLFERHKQKFIENPPESLYTFLSEDPAQIPCPAVEISVYEGRRLLACSFLDVGKTAVSSIYAMYDPAHSPRSLGILTMLLEIDFARQGGKTLYYHGYAYQTPSYYDYKKKFAALEYYDWQSGSWQG